MAKASAKHRLVQNRQRLQVLLVCIAVADLLYLLRVARRWFPFWEVLLMALNNLALWLVYHNLRQAAAPEYDAASGALLHAGHDLRTPGLLEYAQDVVYVGSAAQALATFWPWFWLLYAAVPLYASVQLWRYVLRLRREASGRRSGREVRRAVH